MEYTVKFATEEDLPEAARVEAETMGSYTYLTDAWQHYASIDGQLICVYKEDKMVGIGRFSVLPDGSGWLECLRVAPDYQNQGVGKKIYEAYLELADTYGCPSMGMYTGPSNVRSKGLAERFGLMLQKSYREYALTSFEHANAHTFKQVNWKRAEELIVPMKEEYNDNMTFNRTFYHINKENARAFGAEGKVYEAEDGSFIVCGGRFQHSKALHVAMMGGDYEACLDFAENLAKSQNIPQITCNFALENEKLEQVLIARGFERGKSDLITKEIIF